VSKREFETTGQVDLTEEIDLDRCHNDPIHQTALIMPHGAFLQLEPKSLEVLSISRNADQFLPNRPDELLNRSLEKTAGPGWESAIRDRLPIQRGKKRFIFQPGETRYLIGLFPIESTIGLEIQPAYPVGNSNEETMVELRQRLTELRHYSDRDRLYDVIVGGIRDVTEFDRVMLYQFNPEGHGSVVAEDRRDDLHSYLNQQFPASDIPEPARRLYRMNEWRYIPTIDYEPVELVDEDGSRTVGELDLSRSDLRNVPAVHREYMANMNVSSSLSVPIVIDHELWGLIACHGESEHSLDWPRRDLAGLIGLSATQQIARFDAEERTRRSENIASFRTELNHTAAATEDLPEILNREHERIMSFLDATGFCLCLDGRECVYSTEDNESIQRSLLDLVSDRLRDEEVVAVRSIEREIDEDWEHSDRISGFLAIRLDRRAESFCVWFRPEHLETIRWGGDPRHPVEVDEEGRISPRNSFEEWKQVVSGQCQRWSSLDRMTAQELVRFFEKEAIEKQSRKLAEYNEELESQNKELRRTRERLVVANRRKEDLMDELQHRVKNNFQLVLSTIRLKKREVESEEARHIIRNIENRLESMAALHRALYENEDGVEVELSDYFTSLIDTILDSFSGDSGGISIERELEKMTLDTDQAVVAGIVLTELLTNAFEHGFGSDPGAEGTIHVKLEREENGGIHLVVADNGKGLRGDTDDIFQVSLGLKLVKSIVADQLGGTIEVTDEDGAQFDIHIPSD
jgi:chemotaxis family two-component system sensor kinase Cph1